MRVDLRIGKSQGFYMVIDLWKTRWNQEVHSRAGVRLMAECSCRGYELKCQGVCSPLLVSDLFLHSAHKLVQGHDTYFFKEIQEDGIIVNMCLSCF